MHRRDAVARAEPILPLPMTDPILSPQALSTSPPLRPVGYLNLALALARGIAGVLLIAMNSRSLQAFQSTINGSRLSPVDVVELASLGIAILLVFSAIGKATRSVGQLGAVLIPPRAPADFTDHKEDVAVALQRQEMPAYRLPKNSQFELAHKLFPQLFPLLTVRVRQQLAGALSSASSAVWWAVLAVLVVWASHTFLVGIPSVLLPGVPLTFLSGIAIAAAARMAFVYAQFPKQTPSSAREEFRLSLGGGGDPKLIPTGLEHELMSFRSSAGAPNRGTCYGFEMNEGGVRNSGDFEGTLVVETQPVILAGREVPRMEMLFAAAVVVTGIALVMLVNRPDYLALLSRYSGDNETAIVLVRWLVRSIGAGLLLGAANGLVAHAEHFLNVFTYSSTAIAVRVSGTFGRAGLKVGKGIHDSIESENVVVRSDSSVVGYLATIESESEGLQGVRSITAMKADRAVVDVRELVERWFQSFSAKGADIVGLDMSSAKVAQMVNANVAIDARRTGARQAAKSEARETVQLREAALSPLLAAATNGSEPERGDTGANAVGNAGDQEPGPGEQSCPDCAEIIKLAARKCRFCGYRFDG